MLNKVTLIYILKFCKLSVQITKYWKYMRYLNFIIPIAVPEMQWWFESQYTFNSQLLEN